MLNPGLHACRLETTFNCPFCNSSKSVVCTLDHEKELGTVRCNQCHSNFQTQISHLTEPVDIYHDWIDECEKVNT